MKTLHYFNRGKSIVKGLALMTICFAVLTTSCKKNDDDDSPSTPTTPTETDPPTPQPKDANGTMVAVQSVTVITVPGFGDQEVPFYTAVAVFYDDPTSGAFLNAGTVMCEGSDLTKQSNNSYTFIPSQTNPQGLDFNGNIDWEVSGAGTVPTISESINIGFPSVGSVNSDSLIKKTEDYTLSCNFVSSADSIIWMIGGLIHTTAGGQSSYTFTKDELSTLAAGPSIAQVAAYRYTSSTTDGKNYYYINEDVKSKQVALQ